MQSTQQKQQEKQSAVLSPAFVLFCTIDVLTDGSEHTGLDGGFCCDTVNSISENNSTGNNDVSHSSGTVFLSIWRKRRVTHQQEQQKQQQHKTFSTAENEPMKQTYTSNLDWNLVDSSFSNDSNITLLARYCVSGLGDLLARTCADQRYKLNATFRGVFVTTKSISSLSSTTTPEDNVPLIGFQGLPALLYVLHQSGCKEFSIVSTANPDTIDSLVHLVHPSRKSSTCTNNNNNNNNNTNTINHHPMVHLCQVPSLLVDTNSSSTSSNIPKHDDDDQIPSTCKTDTCITWWKVYEDEYIIVHATPVTDAVWNGCCYCCFSNNYNNTNKSSVQQKSLMNIHNHRNGDVVFVYTFHHLINDNDDDKRANNVSTKNSILIVPSSIPYTTPNNSKCQNCNDQIILNLIKTLPCVTVLSQSSSTTTTTTGVPISVCTVIYLGTKALSVDESSVNVQDHQHYHHHHENDLQKRMPFEQYVVAPSPTTPTTKRISTTNNRLLVRAQEQVRKIQNMLLSSSSSLETKTNLDHDDNIMNCFPSNRDTTSSSTERNEQQQHIFSSSSCMSNELTRLETGMSLVLCNKNNYYQQVGSIQKSNNNNNTTTCYRKGTCTMEFIVVDRIQQRMEIEQMKLQLATVTNPTFTNTTAPNGTKVSSSYDNVNEGKEQDCLLWMNQIKQFLIHSNDATIIKDSKWTNERQKQVIVDDDDENEIPLDDDDDDANDDHTTLLSGTTTAAAATTTISSAKLLVLGTGCASPSSHRNSSGYALLFNSYHPNQSVDNNNTNINNDNTVGCKDTVNDSQKTVNELIIAFEVGEGFCTQWKRYSNGRSLHLIRAIWISHAHWDHYGGLVNLLLSIYHSNVKHRCSNNKNRLWCVETNNQEEAIEEKQQEQGRIFSKNNIKRKRQGSSNNKEFSSRTSTIDLDDCRPWLFAPQKVFQFLNLIFTASSSGTCTSSNNIGNHNNYNIYYRPIDHNNQQAVSNIMTNLTATTTTSLHEFQSQHAQNVTPTTPLQRPIQFWETVRVDHSCKHAYGFVCGIRQDSNSAITKPYRRPYVFCFSGDTRPCWNLVRACRRYHVQQRQGFFGTSIGDGIHFLLHEATFDEQEKEMCIRKKHSTIEEALQVAIDVKAQRVLLTHFSQRYEKLLVVSTVNNDSTTTTTTTTTTNNNNNNKHILSNAGVPIGYAIDGLLIPLT